MSVNTAVTMRRSSAGRAAASAARGVPHARQNLASGGFACPQAAQLVVTTGVYVGAHVTLRDARALDLRITRVSFDDWVLAFHVLSAFAYVAGIVLFWVLIVALGRRPLCRSSHPVLTVRQDDNPIRQGI